MPTSDQHHIQPVGFWTAFGFWLKLGFISFGGPAGQIAVMHEELVVRRRWVSEGRFLHALNYCMMLPGPEAQQLATYLGWLMHRTWGGVVAGGLFVLPSLLLLLVLSYLYMAFGQMAWMVGILAGIKPAVVAIVAHAVFRIGSRVLKQPWLWGVAVASWVAVAWGQVAFPWVILLAALVGWGMGQHSPNSTAAPAHAAVSSSSSPQACWINDDTPIPPHARWSWSRFWRVCAVGMGVWAGTMGLLVWQWGWAHTLTQMGWFFTKAALLTFGGAYAVLPYVHEAAVTHFSWLSTAQMMDGLALGESTPGPLIMVVAFVGFVGGYGHAFWGADAVLLAGVAAACVATWFTFLPSFLFILAGGPLVESTRGQVHLDGPLAAITAAVVGVMLNLALFFAQQVLWSSDTATWNGSAILLTLGAGVALWRFKRSVLEVIAACAVLGLLAHMV
ncbi:MAG: hypothetical protein RLZZ612_2351 [Pseudomonadota bacterium]